MDWTREEFAAAVTQYAHRMFRAARSVLDCDADAEDAVAQAVLQAWQSLSSLRDKNAVGPWLVKIAVNCAYTQRRGQGRVVYLEELAQEPAAPEPPRCSGLWEAVCTLPPERRVEVRLFDLNAGPGHQILWENTEGVTFPVEIQPIPSLIADGKLTSALQAEEVRISRLGLSVIFKGDGTWPQFAGTNISARLADGTLEEPPGRAARAITAPTARKPNARYWCGTSGSR